MMNRVNINIGGKDRQLIASFQNIVDIENELGMSIFKILSPMLRGEGAVDLSFKQMITIIYHGLKGLPDNPLERESIRNEVMAGGYSVYLNDCLAYLLACVSGTKKKIAKDGEIESSEILPNS